MDILHTAEKIMDGGKSIDPMKSIFLAPGSFVTIDIPGSGDSVYKVLSISGGDVARVKNTETKKIYEVPTEFVSIIALNDPYNIDDIKNFRIKKDGDDGDGESDGQKVNRIGIKKPGDIKTKDKQSKNGEYLINGQPQFAKSRYDKTDQLAKNPLYTRQTYNH